MNPENAGKLKQLLSEKSRILITTHRAPDGDAIGSSLALYHYLKARGKKVVVVAPDSYPSFLHWMPGHSEVILHEKQPLEAEEKTRDAEIIFCLDFNRTDRLEKYSPLVENSTAVKVLIDHHQDPDNFAAFVFSDTSASSTAQLIYELLAAMDGPECITSDIAACLYAGIMTDSGSFRFPSTTARTHEIVSKLIATGIRVDEIYDRIFDNYSIGRMKLLGYCLNEKMQIFQEYKTGLISVSAAELEKFRHQKGDMEGIVNFPLSIKEVRFSALITEQKDRIKLSFRSKGNFSVDHFAREHFSGGGHINASGGTSHDSFEQTVARFIRLLPSYNTKLNSE